MLDYGYDEEREAALAQDAMTQGEYMSAALAQYAAAYGEADPTRAWVLTPYDTWERNPYYQGPPVRHPEDDQDAYGDDEAPFYEEGERPGPVFRAPAPHDPWDCPEDDEIPF